MHMLPLAFLLCYAAAQQKERHVLDAAPQTLLFRSEGMSDASLAGPTPVVQIPGGTIGVVYREVRGCPHYAIGDDGTLWSSQPTTRHPAGWHRMFPTKAKGHLYVNLVCDGTKKLRPVHQLVLEAFVGPRPDGLESLHENDNGCDNRLSNLRWGTHGDNMQDMVRNGTAALGARSNFCKTEEALISQAKTLMLAGHSLKAISESTGIIHSRLYSVAIGDTWAWLEPHLDSSTQTPGCRVYRKLSDAQRLEIGLRGTNGERHRDLAKEFGVSKTLVGNIVRLAQRRERQDV